MCKIIIKVDGEDVRLARRTRRPKTVTFSSSTQSPVEPAKLRNGPILVMAQTCYQQIMREIAPRIPEVGGWLIGPIGHHMVTSLVMDTKGRSTPASFTWDHAHLNDILRKHIPLGYDAKGCVHLHPPDCRQLSSGDLLYVKQIFANPKNDVHEVFMPLVVDGIVLPFIVYANDPDDPQFASLQLI